MFKTTLNYVIFTKNKTLIFVRIIDNGSGKYL
jgi:hypothetical protein